jgi:hypothetical protein
LHIVGWSLVLNKEKLRVWKEGCDISYKEKEKHNGCGTVGHLWATSGGWPRCKAEDSVRSE